MGTYGEAFLKNWTTIGAEMIGAGVSCGLTVAAAGGIAAAVSAGPASAGLSWTALGALWVGFGTGAIQCGNGAVRVGTALYDPSLAILRGWDENSFYAVAILLVDAIGVATAVSSLPSTVSKLWGAFSRLRSFKAINLSFDALTPAKLTGSGSGSINWAINFIDAGQPAK